MSSTHHNKSNDGSELSDVDRYALEESATSSETPKSPENPITSEATEVNKTNGSHSQAVKASLKAGADDKIMGLDTQSTSETESGQEQYDFLMASDSPKNKMAPQPISDGVEKFSAAKKSQYELPKIPSNGLKRKSSPSDSPNTSFTTSTCLKTPDRPDLSAPKDFRLSSVERQSPSSSDSTVNEQKSYLRKALLNVSSDVAQAILREQWRVFLFTKGDDDVNEHITFVLRAGLKNAKPSQLMRTFRDTGVMKNILEEVSNKQPVITQALKNATAEQIQNLVPGDVLDQAFSERFKNASAERIEALLPTNILDQALAERLKIVPAKTLIRWMAEADRLGYSNDDILDENDETVIPNIQDSPQNQNDSDTEMTYDGPANNFAPSLDPLEAEQQQTTIAQAAQLDAPEILLADLRCPICTYKFDTVRGYNYHRSKNICTRAQPHGLRFYCGNCAQGFTTKQGMLYHEKRRVCLGQVGEEDEKILYQDSSHMTPPQYQSPYPPQLQSSHPSLGPGMQQHLQKPNNAIPMLKIPRPPLRTPAAPKNVQLMSNSLPDGSRQSLSELSPEKRGALELALQRIDEKYAADQAAIPNDWPQSKIEARLISLKNGNASRKSQVRKQFGVTLRMRDKDKEAKKRRDVLGETFSMSAREASRYDHARRSTSRSEEFSSPGPSGPNRFEDGNVLTPATFPQELQKQLRADLRMQIMNARPVTGFSPINTRPQHQQSSQPATPQGFVPSHQSPLMVQHPSPGLPQNTMPFLPSNGNGVPPPGYQAGDHTNKRIKRDSGAGMARAEEERSRHFPPSSKSSPINIQMKNGSGSGSNLNGQAGRSSENGENTTNRANGGTQESFRRVPVDGLQRIWEAHNGKRPASVNANTCANTSMGATNGISKIVIPNGDNKGKDKEPVGYVDLISESESTGGDSGGEAEA